MISLAKMTATAPRRVSILGSTGSIGCSTISLIDSHPGQYQVEALTAFANVGLLAEQALRLRPKLAVIGEAALYEELCQRLAGSGIAVAAGEAALCDAATMPADWIMAAIVGAAGLRPTLAAIRQGATVALANKECLVCAGDLFIDEVHRHNATLLPVDSEHNAIFQVFDARSADAVEKLTLTASGGPFRSLSPADMARVTPSQAVSHPNWSMGAKISVDSATMMNKGLEVIEAFHLFPVPADRIDVLVHPQSIVHSMVSYADGSVLAQLGTPDMRTPIAYALGWPSRISAPSARLDLTHIGQLTFEAPDPERFPALTVARQALLSGGAAPTILNAANEVAVAFFLEGTIGYLDIVAHVERTLSFMPNRRLAGLDDVFAVDDEARRVTAQRIVRA